MIRILRWAMVLCCACMLILPVLAQDDEDDGGTLDPNTQWRFADAFWNRREYAEAAALMQAYADTNPDEPNAMEARWRIYVIFRNNRPNAEKRKTAFTDLVTHSERWEKKYAGSNKERAAAALWYRASAYDNEGNRALAIPTLQDLVKKYAGTNYDHNAYWTLGEWLNQARRYPEAIEAYQADRRVCGPNAQGANAQFRIGLCYEALNDTPSAVMAYTEVLNNPSYNWGWWEVHRNALDAARRLQKLGEDELSRRFLMKIMDACNKDSDVVKQAMAELGITPTFKVWVMPHISHHYTAATNSIDGRSKLTLVKEIPVLVRSTFVSKENPFAGTLTVTPKVELQQVPENMTKAEGGDGKPTYTVEMKSEKGGDAWYRFTQQAQTVAPPDGLVVTRKWEKAGNTWGECTVRIQSTARWHVWIYLPNNKTNVDNLTFKPNQVEDGGKVFRWYDWFDLKQGITIKFPVEVGANISEYLPKIRLEHGTHNWFYRETSASGKEAVFETRELTVKLAAEKEFPYTFSFPGSTDVILEEVSK